jgi:hypothetical protein
VSSGIFHLHGDELVELAEQPYDSEERLQRLLADHPALMPEDQIDSDEPRRWLLIQREMGVPSIDGSADHPDARRLGLPKSSGSIRPAVVSSKDR